MIGGTGFDELHGGAGNDLIFNSDHGRLFGDEGADLLVGVGPGELLASGGDDVDEALARLGRKRNITVFTRHYQVAVLLAESRAHDLDDLVGQRVEVVGEPVQALRVGVKGNETRFPAAQLRGRKLRRGKRGTRDAVKAMAAGLTPADLAWVLANTREFLFLP